MSVAKQDNVGTPGVGGEIASREALKGIESNSKEGISEMFRLMRGGGEMSIAEQQLEEQRKTNELLSEGDPEQVMAMAGG